LPKTIPALTTTSYAILGHLAMQPWTMYDLAAQMRRNVHFFFPRVESQVYAEPKRLIAAGLANAATEMTGRRARTVYSITPAGRKELSRWLKEPVARGPLLEFETMLRVLLSPFGTDEDLAAALQSARDDINSTLLALAERISDEYAAGVAPFQRYVQYRSIMHDFLVSYGQLIDDWAERSLDRIADWPGQTEAERKAIAVSLIDKKRPKKKPRSRNQ
jgi:PadR family transcriptional regulator, regulatory protein AphA